MFNRILYNFSEFLIVGRAYPLLSMCRPTRAMTNVGIVTISTLARLYDRTKGMVHVRISPDANLRYPPCAPSPVTDRQFSPCRRAYRRDAAGSRDQQRRSRLRWSDQPQRSRICQGAARRAAGAMSPSARQSRHRRQPDGGRPRTEATGDREGATELSRRDRRRPLALRCGGLELYRAELADHEYQDRERGGAVRLAGVRARAHQRQAGRAVPAQAALSEHA